MGNTSPGLIPAFLEGDHPHTHGEYEENELHPSEIAGSPPYTWGIRNGIWFITASFRITPIHMGNTSSAFLMVTVPGDHPHTHGEYRWGICISLQAQGSPPYTWGIPFCDNCQSFTRGITPIHMGNTLSSLPNQLVQWDHPHTHGEYWFIHKPSWTASGSPPYTWGIQ